MAGPINAGKAKGMLPSMQPTSLAPPSGDDADPKKKKKPKKDEDSAAGDDLGVEIAIPMG